MKVKDRDRPAVVDLMHDAFANPDDFIKLRPHRARIVYEKAVSNLFLFLRLAQNTERQD